MTAPSVPGLQIRPLAPADAAAYQALRLRGLLECPEAFAASHEEEASTPLAEIEQGLEPRVDGAIFGAFTGEVLCALVGLQRETFAKLAHKSFIWGVYVAPEARGRGVGAQLLSHVLAHASTALGSRQVNLGVNTRNTAAIALYRKLGFVAFGLERGFLLVDGRLHDEHQMVWQANPVPQESRDPPGRRGGPADPARLPDAGARGIHAAHMPGARATRSIGLVSLVVRDYDEALSFYVGTLGFALVEDTPIPAQNKRWVVVSPPGASQCRLLLARASTDDQRQCIGRQTGGRVFLFLYTDDFWRDFHTYRGKGVVFVREPSEEPYGTVAVFEDLHGNLWDLLQPRSPAL